MLAVAEPPETAARAIAVQLLARAGLLLGWLAFAGWGVARLTRRNLVGLRAPFLGLALFALFAEGGTAFRLRPAISAGVLTVAALAVLLVSFRVRPPVRRLGPRRLRAGAGAIALVVGFAAAAVVPFASHGEGAILGHIDDGIREAAHADSLNLYGTRIPPDATGYIASMGSQMKKALGRRGGAYLLSTLAAVFGERAHAVYSAAMLGLGGLAVLGVALLAARVLRPYGRWRWIAPLLVAVNSVLLVVLYGQHLGNLLSVSLFLAFLHESLALPIARRWHAAIPAGLLIAASWTLYTETLPLWGAAGAASLLVAGRRRWRGTVARYALAVGISVLVNPVGAARTMRLWGTFGEATWMRSSYNRRIAGDTHYFPTGNVVTGIEAYREDAPAAVGRTRALLMPVANLLIAGTVIAGWARLTRRRRAMVVWLLAPVGLALLTNYRLNFPYGYARFLPLAVPVWAVAFSLLASTSFAPRGGRAPVVRGAQRRRSQAAWTAALAGAALGLVAILALPAARHVHARAARLIPAYDPAYRVLPSLAAAAGRDAVIFIEPVHGAEAAWLMYFLGGNAVQPLPVAAPHPGLRYFVLGDRREPGGGTGARARPVSRYFALRPPDAPRAAS